MLHVTKPAKPATGTVEAASTAQQRSTYRRVARWLALDSRRPIRDLSIGFVLGGLGVALNVGIYGAAGWYHVESVHFDLRPLLVSGLIGYLWIGVYEELLARGLVLRLLEHSFGTTGAGAAVR